MQVESLNLSNNEFQVCHVLQLAKALGAMRTASLDLENNRPGKGRIRVFKLLLVVINRQPTTS